MPQRQLDEAIKQVPGTIAKQHGGKPTKRERKSFQIYTVSQLMESFRDPRAVLMEIASTDTHTLAEQIGCTLMEALGERRLCAQAVLPYVAQKLPVQVDMRHTRAIHLNIVDERQYKQLVDISQDAVIEQIAHDSSAEDGDTDQEQGDVEAPNGDVERVLSSP